MTDYLQAEHHPNCYPSNPKTALNFFRKALNSFPAKELPPSPAKKNIAGIIMPHIDFRVSLASYAAAFHLLLGELLADTYLILGVGHRSQIEWNLDRRDYVTPLGRVGCARELVDILAEGATSSQYFSPEGHHGEHSIEFALVWLQALHRLHPGKTKKKFRFVPLLCGGLYHYVEQIAEWKDLADFHRLSRNLAHLFEKNPPGEKLRVIVSIDGCHIGPRFHHPFAVTPAILKSIDHWEKNLWACASAGDARNFLDWFRVEGNIRGFDGVGALGLLLAAGAGKFTLQRTCYEQWFSPHDASVVTFSSGRVLASRSP
ncbi:MAG TPA: AmmeMemoRadiSam system protein B [Candidatus Methylacidiphilales bacterium]|nr:AmmeMemoRadiSam system protein B [Candidatus Methylacidiphilales bacterium]